MGYAEFAALISSAEHTVRARRVEIWLTGASKRLDPAEARSCVEWRDKIAAKLLAREPTGRDAYDRSSLLLALFPRLKSEYHLILMALPDLRSLVRDNSEVDEKAIADFFIRKDTPVSKRLLLWLPRLMPFILKEKQAIAGTDRLTQVAVTILTVTCAAPRTVVDNAVHKTGRRLAPAKVRNLFRIHFAEDGARIGLLGTINLAVNPHLPEVGKSRKADGKPSGHRKGWTMKRTQERLRVAAAFWCFGLNDYKIAPIVYSGHSKSNADAADKFGKLTRNQNKSFQGECNRLNAASAEEILRILVPEK